VIASFALAAIINRSITGRLKDYDQTAVPIGLNFHAKDY